MWETKASGRNKIKIVEEITSTLLYWVCLFEVAACWFLTLDSEVMDKAIPLELMCKRHLKS